MIENFSDSSLILTLNTSLIKLTLSELILCVTLNEHLTKNRLEVTPNLMERKKKQKEISCCFRLSFLRFNSPEFLHWASGLHTFVYIIRENWFHIGSKCPICSTQFTTINHISNDIQRAFRFFDQCVHDFSTVVDSVSYEVHFIIDQCEWCWCGRYSLKVKNNCTFLAQESSIKWK